MQRYHKDHVSYFSRPLIRALYEDVSKHYVFTDPLLFN